MGRNRRKIKSDALAPEASRHHVDRVFHVWGRAIDDMHTFPTTRSKASFLHLFERYLSPQEFKDPDGRPYRKLSEMIELVGFAVLDNHYHLLLRQKLEAGVITLMRSVLPTYGRYFNDTHGRRAQIFESPYSVRPIEDEADLRHMVGYVHGQHESLGLEYEHTSHRLYLGEAECDWLQIEPGLAAFGSRDSYATEIEAEVREILSAKVARRAETPLPPSRPLTRGRGDHIARRRP